MMHASSHDRPIDRWFASYPGDHRNPTNQAIHVVAWIAQFIGHGRHFEAKKPSFFTDLRYLMTGPARVLSKAFPKLDLRD